MSGDGDGDADAAVTTERAALALGPLKVRNSQEFAILVTLLVASVLLLTLVVIGLLCCCGSCWHYVSEQWWRLARKLRRQPSAGPSSRKVCIDDAESKIRSGLTNPAFDSTLLDLGEEPPLRVVTSSPEQGPGPQDTPTSARVAREMYRTRTQSSAESVSSEAPLVASRKPSESGAESPLVRSSVGTPVAVRSNSVRIPTDLGTIDPSLYEEWQAPSSSTLVTTASRKISVLPRSHSAAGSQNAGGSAHVDARGKLYLSLKYDKADCKLIVTIQRAEALPIRDFSGTVDSFVKVLLLPDRKPKYQTKTQKKTIEPVFNETFEFTVQPDQLPLRTLVFSVHDFDRFSRSCLLGSCAIDMSAIHTQITHDSIDFDVLITNVCTAGHAVDELGEILISLSYLTNVERLTICIMKCQNLKPMDLSGSADPYVVVEVYHGGRRTKKRKTDIKKRTLVPVYNEAFIFDIPLADMPLICVLVKVYDYDRLSADDLIGSVALGEACSGPGRAHWLESIANQRRSIAKWHKLGSVDTVKTYLPQFMQNVQIVSEFNLVRLKDKLRLGQSLSVSGSGSQNDTPEHSSAQSASK